MAKKSINPDAMAPPVGPYSHVVSAPAGGRIVFCAGAVALDADGNVVGKGDIVAQTRQVHENIKRCLAAAGGTFADVCKVTVFLKNVADREKVNTVRKEYFGAHRPASTLIEISRLVRDDLLIEIEATAVLPNGATTGRAEPRASRAGHLRLKPASRTPRQQNKRRRR